MELLREFNDKGYMTSPEYFSKEELIDAVELCLENAEQYIKDAELLMKSSSFGHAYAFGVLAYEELGKAVMCIFGVLLYWFENKGIIDKRRWRNGKLNPFMKHETKQKIMKFIDELFEVTNQLFGAKELEIEILRLSEEDVKRFKRSILQHPFYYIRKFKEDLEGLLRERGTVRILKEFTLEESKWCGLYVDYKDGKFISPKTVRKDDAVIYLEDIKRSFERAKEFSNRILEFEHHIAAIKTFAEFIERIAHDL